MFTQDDIDAVLQEAQAAVNSLSQDVGRLVEHESVKADSAPHHGEVNAPDASLPARPGALERNCRPSDRVRRILKLEVPLLVQLASRPMSVREIMRIGPGTILEFDRTVNCKLDLMINNCRIGSGVAVKVGERFGLRIAEIGNVSQRISSLARR